ncbi:MAG TPA: caspase family protein [Syntrophobacteraceae bacterium]|nr:caspase family protein [Syntrophobacteraceae bacterium]
MKKALLVGINDYPGTFCDLMGCVNDVQNMQDLLTSLFGFRKEDICILTDRDATALNILKALEMLVYDAKPGDQLIFHYSGHGSQVPDTSGDEKDRWDEILCPYDLDWSENVVRDDDLNRIFETVPAGVHVEVFLDSCHSGTGLRALEGEYRKQRFLPVPVEVMGSCTPVKSIKPIKPAKVQVLWAACRSNQYAADALLNGKYGGAFTTFLCDLVRSSQGTISRKDLLTTLRKGLKANRFAQVPQLETGTKLKKARILAA